MKAELKMLTAFVLFTFNNAIVVINNSVASRTYKEFEQELTDYFTCESTGVSPGKACSRSGFENVDYTPILVTTGVILLTVYPFVTLIYVANITEIKRALLKWVKLRENSNSNAIRGRATPQKPDKVTVPLSLVGGGNRIVSTETQTWESTYIVFSTICLLHSSFIDEFKLINLIIEHIIYTMSFL